MRHRCEKSVTTVRTSTVRIASFLCWYWWRWWSPKGGTFVFTILLSLSWYWCQIWTERKKKKGASEKNAQGGMLSHSNWPLFPVFLYAHLQHLHFDVSAYACAREKKGMGKAGVRLHTRQMVGVVPGIYGGYREPTLTRRKQTVARDESTSPPWANVKSEPMVRRRKKTDTRVHSHLNIRILNFVVERVQCIQQFFPKLCLI